MRNSSNDTGMELGPCILFYFIFYFFLLLLLFNFSFLNLITDGFRFEDKLCSANKLTNASALSCPLGKSFFSNLIGYACNLYPFFISFFLFLSPYFIPCVFRF